MLLDLNPGPEADRVIAAEHWNCGLGKDAASVNFRHNKMNAAARQGHAEVSAAVSFYGMLATAEKTSNRPAAPLDMIGNLGCPLLGLYGTDDALVPREDLDQLATACEQGGHRLSLQRYRGAGHAFLNRFRPEAYREEAARDAWQRALNFLTVELG